MSAGERRERIILDLPVGSDRERAQRAARVAYDFASAHIGRPRGIRHAVPYTTTRDGRVVGDAFVAWWTEAGAVKVRVEVPDASR